MINIYQYEKAIKDQIDSQREQDKKKKWDDKYKGKLCLHETISFLEDREDMIMKYKKRIMQFIDKVIISDLTKMKGSEEAS